MVLRRLRRKIQSAKAYGEQMKHENAVQFAGRKSHPVSAHITAAGWISNGISFDDYSRMATRTRKTSGERRLPTPIWAMNNPMLRRVLVSFMEERAFSKKERGKLRKKAGLKERLNHARNKIISKRPAAMSVLDRLCADYVEIKNNGLKPGMTDKEWNTTKKQPYMEFAESQARIDDEQIRIKQLEREIEGIDTYLRISENGGADIVAAIVYLYYRTGLDSVGVGAELGLKPPHVRQTLFRMHQTAKNLDKKYHKPAKKSEKKNRFVVPALFGE
jgi:hypothetical protein